MIRISNYQSKLNLYVSINSKEYNTLGGRVQNEHKGIDLIIFVLLFFTDGTKGGGGRVKSDIAN